jgi:hypothetical protein
MDVDTRSKDRSVGRATAKDLEGYTVYLLSLDGTIATIKKKLADNTFRLTVEIRDRKSERKLPAEVARNPGSDAFTRAVREMKDELLGIPTSRPVG